MLKRSTLYIFFAGLLSLEAAAQDPYIISGKIFDSVSNLNLAGASIKVKGANSGTVAAEDGSFHLKTTQKLPITLIVTSIGYKALEFTVREAGATGIAISLNSQSVLVDQVVVTASRVSESILRSPVTIEKLDLRAIKASPAPSFYDALENVKGVQMTTLSLGYKVPNTRGFSGTTNSRFLQMVDGVDNISPGIGAPVANAVGPTELDIESVELIPGAASAIYGLNAINGIANLKTKSPFQFEGLSVYQKLGVNHVNDKEHSAALYDETAIRWAKVIGRSFAFKINAAHSEGTDWIADNQHDQYYDQGNKTNTGLVPNPAADLINRYGDEYNSDLKTLTLQGKKIRCIENRLFRKRPDRLCRKEHESGRFSAFQARSGHRDRLYLPDRRGLEQLPAGQPGEAGRRNDPAACHRYKNTRFFDKGLLYF